MELNESYSFECGDWMFPKWRGFVLYRAMGDVFEETLKNIRIEGNKDVYYGGYMEELRLVGRI